MTDDDKQYEFYEDGEGRVYRGLFREEYGRALTIGAVWRGGTWEKIPTMPVQYDMTLCADPAAAN
ncbi:MAG: hypothetical protein JNJ45_12170 [Chthonomonas sp.]|nr:hypothetical protein [Chthonomonas sp.]